MRFRPCIDIHNGRVKQIVGGTLCDKKDEAVTNFCAEKNADYYAKLYKKDGLTGGHVILLNGKDSPYYEKTKEQAMLALRTYPGGLQAGGGITPETAGEYLHAGASHVIVTSYMFLNGRIEWERLKKLRRAAGKDNIVIDVSCRRKGGRYYIVTDRWQTFTEVELTPEVLNILAEYCDEFLVHGVDAEGKASGVESRLVEMLGRWNGIPVTYAGGIGTMEDLQSFRRESSGKLDFTIGSALDLFGGKITYDVVKKL